MALRVEVELSLGESGIPVFRYLVRGDHGLLERSEGTYRSEPFALAVGRKVAVLDYGATEDSLVIW